MVKAFLSAALLVAFCTATQAAPSASTRQASASSSHKYWLSDGLNRLVFWRPPAASQRDEKTH